MADRSSRQGGSEECFIEITVGTDFDRRSAGGTSQPRRPPVYPRSDSRTTKIPAHFPSTAEDLFELRPHHGRVHVDPRPVLDADDPLIDEHAEAVDHRAAPRCGVADQAG